jgi:hypothetical protein
LDHPRIPSLLPSAFRNKSAAIPIFAVSSADQHGKFSPAAPSPHTIPKMTAATSTKRPTRRRQQRKPQAFCGVLLASVSRKQTPFRRGTERQEGAQDGHELREEVHKMQASVSKMQQQVQVAARAIKQLHGLVALLAAQRQARGE